MNSPPLPSMPRDRVAWLLVWAGPVAVVAGILVHRLWQALPLSRSLELFALCGIVAALSWPGVRLARWSWATSLAITWLALLVLFAGPAPVAAAGVLAVACIATGSTVAGRHIPLAFAAGAAIIAATVGWLLPLPLHRPWVYLVGAVVLIALRRRMLRTAALRGRARWTGAVRRSPRAAAWGVLAVGLASTGAWLPTLQYDDLAYHLGLPWQLMLHGRYALDPTHQVWALAPWGSDVLHGIAQVLARQEARGPWNAAWLAAAAALAWRVAAQLGVSHAGRWAAVALLGTQPLLSALVAGMQTELPAAAVTLALVSLALGERPDARRLIAGGVLVGGLFGLKLMHPLVAIAPALWLGWRHRAVLRGRPLLVPVVLLIAAAVGGSSYAYAWHVAGNPLLPLLNATFRSPYFAAVDFQDARWSTGFGPQTVWGLTFDTDRFMEAWDGGFGFTLVALAGAAIAAARLRGARLALVFAAFAILVPLAIVQYGRYAFIGAVLMLPVAVLAVEASLPRAQRIALIAAVCVANALFLPNGHWMSHTGAVKRVLQAGGRDAPLLLRYAPVRLAIAHVRRTAPDTVVLDLTGAAHAELAGRGRTTAWYAPRVQAQAQQAASDPSGAAWAALFAKEGIGFLVVRPSQLTAAQRAGMARAGAYRTLTFGDVECWRIPARDPQ